MLEESFRKLAKESIQNFVDFMDLFDDYTFYREQTIIKYENSYDFWYGYMVGHCEGYLIGLFEGKYKRHANEEELAEIRENVELEFKHMRKKLEERFKRQD